jgi:hypothetical protein
VLLRENIRIHAAFILAETHRDHVAQVVLDRVIDRALNVRVVVRLARTRTIFAPGAMACAQSTSRLISSAQPVMLGSPGRTSQPVRRHLGERPGQGQAGFQRPFNPGSP